MTIALFVGKFQPPHIGHVMTIVRIYGDYEKIYVGIADFESSDQPKIFAIPEIVHVFTHIFQYMPKVKVLTYHQPVYNCKCFDHFPPFDEIVTGNFNLIIHFKGTMSIRYIPRSTICGHDISSEMMRKVLDHAQK